jgi:hypothetical protein
MHGLYDTLLKKDIDGIALTVGLFSFGLMALMIESAREREGDILVEVPSTEKKPVGVDAGSVNGSAASSNSVISSRPITPYRSPIT